MENYFQNKTVARSLYYIILFLFATLFILQVSFGLFSSSFIQETATAYYGKEVPLFWVEDIQLNGLFLSLIPLIGIVLTLKYSSVLFRIQWTNNNLKLILNRFSNLSKLQWILFLFIFLSSFAVRLQMMTLPLIYDEAFTYNQFSSQSFLTILSEYTYPNNQILHSLFVKLSTSILGISSEWGVRLPSFIAGFFILGVAFLIGKLKNGNRLGLLYMSVFAYLPIIVDYTTLARGYSLVLLFTMLMWLILLHWKKMQVITYNSLFLLFIILGFLSIWTIPLALIPIIILAMFLRQDFKLNEVLLIFIPILLFGSIIYIPAMTKYGLGVVFTYPSKPESSFSLLFSHHLFHGLQHFYYVFLMNKWFVYIILAVFALGVTKYRAYFKDYFIVLAISLLFVFLMRVDPPARIWIFCIPFLYLPIVRVIDVLLSKVKYFPDLMMGVALLLISSVTYLFMPQLSVMKSFRMVEEQNAITYLAAHKLESNVIAMFPSESGIRYYQKVRSRNFNVEMPHKILFINLAAGQEKKEVISWFYGEKAKGVAFKLNIIQKTKKYLLYEIVEYE